MLESEEHLDTREISLYVQRCVRVDNGHVFGVKTNPYLKIKYTFEIFHQPAVNYKFKCRYTYFLHVHVAKNV